MTPELTGIREISIERTQQDAIREAHASMTPEEIENEILVIDIGEKKIAVLRGK